MVMQKRPFLPFDYKRKLAPQGKYLGQVDTYSRDHNTT